MQLQSFNVSDYFQMPNPGLTSYIAKTKQGNKVEYRTAFAKGKQPQEVVEEWKSTLKGLEKEWPSLYEFEIDLAKKVGPLSIQKPLDQRMEDIEHYYSGVSQPGVPVPWVAISSCLSEWKQIRNLHIRDQKLTWYNMKKSTSSGSPFFSRKRLVASKTLPCVAYLWKDRVRQVVNGSRYMACAVLGWRGQEGGPKHEDVKQRVIWMFPFSVNIRELQCYQPLIEKFQQFKLVPAWVGLEEVDQRITALFDTKDPKDLVVCTDFSKFDQHFGKSCQECARTILEHILVDNQTSKDWLHDVFPIKYMIPLLMDDKRMSFGPHGMASGSGGTNADETLCHRALQYEAALLANEKLNPNSMCLGDDGILSYPGIDVDHVVQVYTSHGLEMNPDKQYVSDSDCTYLRRWHHKDFRVNGVCVGVYSTCRAIGKLCEQERFYDPKEWGPKMVALRQLSIIENCKYHPMREEFVKFCMKRDKYRLGIDIPGFLDNIAKIAQTANENMPDFLGYTRGELAHDADGIADWWVVKYLKSLA